MELKASKILQVGLKSGWVPASFVLVGDIDEVKGQPKASIALNKTVGRGHARTLSCVFEPGDKYPGDAVTKTLDLLTKGMKSKVHRSTTFKVGAAEAKHIELKIASGEGVPLAVHAVALMVTGMVHRYTLTVLQEKSDEGFASLQKFVNEACADLV